MDKSKVKYGQIYGVPVYNITLKKCQFKVKDNQYPEWFAAYVQVPKDCSDRTIVKDLEANGADFIFLSHKYAEDEEPKARFLPHNVEVPVFELDEKRHGMFNSEVRQGGDGVTLTISMPYVMIFC